MLNTSAQKQDVIENRNSEETGDGQNQTSTINSGNEDLQGARAAGDKERTLRSHYHDGENRRLSSDTSALGNSSGSSIPGFDRAWSSTNAGSLTWLQQGGTIPDTEVRVHGLLVGAVT